MTENDCLQSVFDILYYRKLAPSNSCLVANSSLAQLLAFEEIAIDSIETIIRDVIVSGMEAHVKAHGFLDPNAMFREGTPFPGLSEVLGAYWTISSTNHAERAVAFMRGMPWSVQAEAILAMVIRFNPSRSVERLELPLRYSDYLASLADSKDVDVEKVACYATSRLAISQVDRSRSG